MVAVQRPRIESFPDAAMSELGVHAVELAASAGSRLDPWQAYVLERSLGLDENGRFAAAEVGVNVARQNGKGVVLEARELAGIFLLGERLITHSSHQQDTSLEAMRRMLESLEEGGLHNELKGRGGVRNTNGQEALVFRSGQRIRYRTRSKGAGRGFSCDCLILDEAMFLPEYAHDALLPSLSAMPNPQVWYAGSAVDQEVHENGVVWARVRERGMVGDPSLAYFEWSADFDSPNDVSISSMMDEDTIAAANPSLGIRITADWVEKERRAMNPRGFAVERMGVGDWPRTDGTAQQEISLEDWADLADPDSEVLDPVCLAFDVGPERNASICAAGRRPDGLWHVEVLENRTGTAWLPKRLAQLVERHAPSVVVCDAYGPVLSILYAVHEQDVKVETVTAGEHTAACGQLVDAVNEKMLRHLGTPELTAAVRGAKTRPLGDAWAWSRKNSSVDISPLVAGTLALSQAMSQPGGDIVIW